MSWTTNHYPKHAPLSPVESIGDANHLYSNLYALDFNEYPVEHRFVIYSI